MARRARQYTPCFNMRLSLSILARVSPPTAQANWSAAYTEPPVYLPRAPIPRVPRRGSLGGTRARFIKLYRVHLIARASPPTAQANWSAACTEPPGNCIFRYNACCSSVVPQRTVLALRRRLYGSTLHHILGVPCRSRPFRRTCRDRVRGHSPRPWLTGAQ